MRGCLNGGASGRLRSTDTSATSRTPSQKPSSSDSTSNSGGSTALAHARNEASACRGRAAGKLIISAELELPRPIAAAGFPHGGAGGGGGGGGGGRRRPSRGEAHHQRGAGAPSAHRSSGLRRRRRGGGRRGRRWGPRSKRIHRLAGSPPPSPNRAPPDTE